MLIEEPDSAEAPELLRLIGLLPAAVLLPRFMQTAVLGWDWILAAAPELTVTLLTGTLSCDGGSIPRTICL